MSNEFKQALKELIETRHATIPWHAGNCGIEIQREHEWQFETMFTLGDVKKFNHSYLAAYDSLGFFTHLLTQFSGCVTYHSTTNCYIHGGNLAKSWISDIIHLPPKCPEMRVQYDGIFVPTYFFNSSLEQCKMLLRCLKLLIKEGGFIMVSLIAGPPDSPGCSMSREMWEGEFIAAGLQTLRVEAEPVELRIHPTDFHAVVKLGALDGA